MFEIHIDYFLYMQGIFKSHLKKITPPKNPSGYVTVYF